MNSTWNNSSLEATSEASSLSSSVGNISPIQQAVYSVVSMFAFFGNTLVILVFVWEKKLLKKSYNILILSLAIADASIGICLVTNPAYIYGNLFPYPESPVLGEIFCRFIWSRFLLFHLVMFSTYICLGLSADRWFAVVKPFSYCMTMTKRTVLSYILVSWVCSLATVSTAVIETVYLPSSRRMCEYRILAPGSTFRVLLAVFQITMMTFFPCLAMIALYIHMVGMVVTSAVTSQASKAKLRGKMTRMIGFVCFVSTICLTPNQITALLVFAGKMRPDSEEHHAVAFLTFATSCVNPVIYGLSNKNYRRSYKKILFLMCPRILTQRAEQENVIDMVNRRHKVEPTPNSVDENQNTTKQAKIMISNEH